MLKCNTNVVLLGSAAQSKSAMFYLTPYLSKSKVAMGTCIQAINSAIQEIKVRPSKADNSGTPIRTTQHWITRCLNKLTSKSEISDQQAAFSLLGNTTDTSSESYSYFMPKEHISLVSQQLIKRRKNMKNLTIDNQEEDNEDTNFLNSWDELLDEYQSVASFSPIYTTSWDENNKPIEKTPVPKVAHYNCRGIGLKNMNRIEYYSIVGIKALEPKKMDMQLKEEKEVEHFPLPNHIHCIQLIANTCSPNKLHQYSWDGSQPSLHFQIIQMHMIQRNFK